MIIIPARAGMFMAVRRNAKAEKTVKAPQELRIGLLEISLMIVLSLFIWWASPHLAIILGHYSYAGAFLIAFLASATVIVPAGPLQFAIIGMGRMLDPYLLGIVAGIGSGLGELSGYFVGQGSLHLLKTKNKTLQWLMDLQSSILKRWAGPGVFLLSALPNPFFDFAGIGAGLMGIKWYEFLFWCITGRILRFILLAQFGHQFIL